MRVLTILLLPFLQSLLALFRRRHEQTLVELALRQQLAVHAQRRRRPRLSPLDRRMRRPRRVALLLVLALLPGCPPLMVEREGHRVFNPFYLPFLEAEARDAWQHPERVLDALALAPDAVVADIGAGGGYFTERLARRLASGGGRVYATDVQPEMLEHLRERVGEQGLANVTVVEAAHDAPTLPDACCDLVFFSSVYKEIDDRVAYMRKVRRVLRPSGRVAILEFRPDAPGAGPPPGIRLAPGEIERELSAAGFVLWETHDFLPRQSFLVFDTRDGRKDGSGRL